MVRKGCQLLSVLLLGVFTVVSAHAGNASATAYDVVENTTDRVMALVSEAKDYVESDPDRYYRELREILDEVVDFSGFARAVMGPYASSERYRSLSDEGKQQLREQASRFTEVMRESLVRTYGKGLIAFGGSRTQVQRPEDGVPDERAMSITQLIYSDAPEPYRILYQMRQDRDGSWKLRNMIVESINLGVIYRNQFQAAARDYEGDLDAVISNWSAPSTADSAGG